MFKTQVGMITFQTHFEMNYATHFPGYQYTANDVE